MFEDEDMDVGSRQMLECIACKGMYVAPGVSACDCCENHANEYHKFVAYRRDKEGVESALKHLKEAYGLDADAKNLSVRDLVVCLLSSEYGDHLRLDANSGL